MPSNGGICWMRGCDRAEIAKITYGFDDKGIGIRKDGKVTDCRIDGPSAWKLVK